VLRGVRRCAYGDEPPICPRRRESRCQHGRPPCRRRDACRVWRRVEVAPKGLHSVRLGGRALAGRCAATFFGGGCPVGEGSVALSRIWPCKTEPQSASLR
jgi:hypothetical protein